MRLIDALQLDCVLNGSMWVSFAKYPQFIVQTIYVHNGRMLWCDNHAEAQFGLGRLHEQVELVEPK